jgi:hypothetical protein
MVDLLTKPRQYPCHYFLGAFRKTQDYVMEEEELEDLED